MFARRTLWKAVETSVRAMDTLPPHDAAILLRWQPAGGKAYHRT